MKAQIVNDEGSASALAIQCAVSSGYPASNFQNYSKGLAMTLALLNGEQQVRVFGYLPQPSSVNGGMKPKAPAGNAKAAATTASASGGLVDLVGSLNAALTGSAPSSAGYYGATAPVASPGEPTPVVNTPTTVVADPVTATAVDKAPSPKTPAPTTGADTMVPVVAAAALNSPPSTDPTQSPVAAEPATSPGSGVSNPPTAELRPSDGVLTLSAPVSPPSPATEPVSNNATPSGWAEFMAFLQKAAAAYNAGGVDAVRAVIADAP